jgi:hypothetical protein
MKKFSMKEEETIRKYALKLRVTPRIIRTVIIAKNVTPAKAAKIIEQVLTRERESKFDF